MKYLIVNIESFQKGSLPEFVKEYINHNPDPFIILDESSKIKTNKACRADKKSSRTVAIQKLNKYGHRAILTGTFLSKSPVNAYDQMCFLKDKYFPEDIFSFERRYCVMITLPIGRGIKSLINEELWEKILRGLNRAKKISEERFDAAVSYYAEFYRTTEHKIRWIYKKKKYTPFMNMKDLYNRIKDDVMIVKKKDALDLPPKLYEVIKVKLDKEVRQLYKEILILGCTEDLMLKKGTGIALYHRLQDVCNGYIPKSEDPEDENSAVYLERQSKNVKLEALVELVDSINLLDYQVVIWSNRKLLLKDIVERLTKEGIKCARFDGDCTYEQRDAIKKDFLSGKIRVFCGNTRSGAFGLDYLKTADYSIFASNDYSAETREQAEDRIHRGGITSSKTIIDIVVEGSVDERVVNNLKVGKELIHSGITDASVFALDEEVYNE